MAHEVDWTNFIVETFLKEVRNEILNDELYEELSVIMRTRARGWSRTKQALELSMSLSTVDRRIRMLKELYDIIQSEKPELGLPKRRSSKEEEWMDNN